MSYPFWDVGVAHGVIMALVAVFHVFVAHFAIGGGLFLVVMERSARKRNDEARLAFVRRLSKFFVLVTVVFGALTGVGIWFTIGLLNPSATEALIHNFVWAWATEWTFFFVEILAAILYFHGWDRMSPKRHMTLGWIYFWTAWLSLVAISGIITFMLTPGEWVRTGAFWDAFLNPTFLPTVVLRTGICLVMAGLFSLLMASRENPRSLRTPLVRVCASWAVLGVLVAGTSWFWYQGAIPEETVRFVAERLPIAVTAMDSLEIFSLILLGFLLVPALLLARFWNPPLAVLGLAIGLGWFGSFEWYREAARKPFVIHSYMYGNGFLAGKEAETRETGLLAHVTFKSGDDGADLFRYACRTCHTLEGYNPIAPAFRHTDPKYVASAIMNLDQMRGAMPPFMGNQEEATKLADWIWKNIEPEPLEQTPGLTGASLGAAVYEARCSRCHQFDGFNDKSSRLSQYTEEDMKDLLQDEEGLEGMPPFSGSEKELEALLEFLRPRLQKGDG